MNAVPANFQPKRILVEHDISDTPMAQRILRRFSDITPEAVGDANAVLRAAAGAHDKLAWQQTLLLARQRGPFLRLCPGTPKHICCLYHNLDVAAGCDLGCTYCILQGYLDSPIITQYCNIHDMWTELETTFEKRANAFFRIGTGELSDSLTFDPMTGLAADLVTFFSAKTNAIIELKSKNVHVESLLDLDHGRRTVMAWSMNSAAITNSEEGRAASLDERLRAAKEVQAAGYRLAFHFDPMIDHDNWRDGYRETVDKIFRVIKPENIAWMSLGALRYPAGFDDTIRRNHPKTKIVLGELLPGIDKKMRYFRPIRVDMFHRMWEWIRGYSDDVLVYLCMESDVIWRRAFGWSPGSSAALKKVLDERVR